jgi:hypothetical protein
MDPEWPAIRLRLVAGWQGRVVSAFEVGAELAKVCDDIGQWVRALHGLYTAGSDEQAAVGWCFLTRRGDPVISFSDVSERAGQRRAVEELRRLRARGVDVRGWTPVVSARRWQVAPGLEKLTERVAMVYSGAYLEAGGGVQGGCDQVAPELRSAERRARVRLAAMMTSRVLEL